MLLVSILHIAYTILYSLLFCTIHIFYIHIFVRCASLENYFTATNFKYYEILFCPSIHLQRYSEAIAELTVSFSIQKKWYSFFLSLFLRWYNNRLRIFHFIFSRLMSNKERMNILYSLKIIYICSFRRSYDHNN